MSTAELGRFASQLRFADLPAEVVTHAKRCVLDSLGCALYGAQLPWTAILRETLHALDSTRSCSVIGSGTRLGAPHAALVNGAAIHAFELDDLHPRSIVHPGSVVIPAALAVAQSEGTTTGAQLLTSVVAGYEVAARVGNTMGSAHLVQGWHPTGTHGTLGAAAAAGSVLGLDPGQMVDALGTAGSQSAGLMSAQYASMTKRFHAGRAAQSGLYAAELAHRGYVGIADLFEAEYGGYGTTFSPSFDPTQLTAGLGTSWETLVVGFKAYSTNGSCHPTIDALLELRESAGVTGDDVEAIRLRVSTATKEHVGWDYEPNTVTTAQMNLPYICAVVLTDGDAFVRQFSAERIVDPRLTELSRRVVVEVDPEIDAEGDPGRHHTRIEVTTRSGERLTDERWFGRGSARRPLTDDELLEKFTKLTQDVVPAPRRQELVAAIEALDSAPDVDHLLGLLEG